MPSSAPILASCSPPRKRRSSRSTGTMPSPGFRNTSVTCSSRRRTPFVCSGRLLTGLLLAAVVAGGGRPLAAQQVDEAVVTQMARLLAASDARRFDPVLLREALQSPDAGVRR